MFWILHLNSAASSLKKPDRAPSPIPKKKNSPRQTKMEWKCDGAEMQSISETEADKPSRGSRIFQQKNICDRAGHARLRACGGVH